MQGRPTALACIFAAPRAIPELRPNRREMTKK
jgi:hypothetical protein